MDKSLFLQISAVILASIIIFCAFVFLVTRSKPLAGVSVPKEDVPYSQVEDYPKDTTLHLTFEDGYAMCLKLEFKDRFITALILEDTSLVTARFYGFEPDESVECSYLFIMHFIDAIDGIDLNIFGEEMRYTGVQVCNILAVNKGHTETQIKVLEAIFNKIYKIGFSSEALSCIMNETENTLSVPDCYGWTEYLGNMCNCYNIVNEG